MRIEIPVCRRCCFCVPLRYGIIAFGYLSLVFSTLLMALETSMAYHHSIIRPSETLYRSFAIYSQLWFLILLHFMDIIFIIVLLIGLHWKKTHLLRVYYYYAISTTAAGLITFIVVRHDDYQKHWYTHLLEHALVFCGIVIEIYLILLIRSEFEKLKQQARLRFVNHITEIPANSSRRNEGWNPL